MRVRIGTRASMLALWQAHEVKRLLEEAHAGIEVVLVEISTQGDRIVDRPLALVGGKGLFVKEIEQALLDEVVDIAVHSAKDLPAEMPPGLTLGAVIPREDPHDVLVSRHGHRLDELPPGARVGTSSLRRRAMLAAARPDLEVVDLRGNLDTRLRKVREGVDGLDAAILAYAGIRRLGFSDAVTEVIPFDVMLPAAGQGVVAVQCRDDAALIATLAPIHHEPSAVRLRAERALLQAIEGSCHLPVGGHAVIEGDRLIVHGRVVSPDGKEVIDTTDEGTIAEADALGRRTAKWLLEQGGDAIIARVNAELTQAATASGARLEGTPVIVTRAAHQATALAAQILSLGGEVHEIPTIRVEPADDAPVIEAFGRLAEGGYDWVAFTSTNGASFAFELLGRPVHIGTTRVAAVGVATADALREHGVRADLVPHLQTGEGLLEAMRAVGVQKGARCLVLGAEVSGGALQDGLRADGVDVDDVTVYRTLPNHAGADAMRRVLARASKGYVSFASPSAAKSFVDMLGDVTALAGWKIACIGPTTATAARELGLQVDVVPPRSTLAEFAAAIANHAARA